MALTCLQLLFEVGHQENLLLSVVGTLMSLCCLPAKLFTIIKLVYVRHAVCAVMLLSWSTGTGIDAMTEGVVCVLQDLHNWLVVLRFSFAITVFYVV